MDTILAAALGDHSFATVDLISSLLESESDGLPSTGDNLPAAPSSPPSLFNLPGASGFAPTGPSLSNLLNPIAEDEVPSIPLDPLLSEGVGDISESGHSAAPSSFYSDSAMGVNETCKTRHSSTEDQSAMDISDEFTSEKQHIPLSLSTAEKRKRSATITSQKLLSLAKSAWAFLSNQTKKPKKESAEKSDGVGISRSATHKDPK